MSHDRPPTDAAFDKALASELKRQPPPSEPCPDPEVIAAFSERSLSARERRSCEAHLTTCDRCQAQLAALVRTADLGTVEEEGTASRRFWPVLDWRWLAPVTAAAVVLLAVWGIEPDALPDRGAPVSSDTDATPGAPDTVEQGTRQAAAERFRPEATGGNRENAELESDAVVMLDETLAQEAATEAVSPAADSRADVPPVAAEPAANSAAAERRSAPPSFAARSVLAPATAELSDPATARTIVSPDSGSMWRLPPTGGIEYSNDGGVSWTIQVTPEETAFTGGVAPSGTVCWVVGPGGRVRRTVDAGASWTEVDVPQRVDLVAIDATDGRTARVETSVGSYFRTDDGGSTWNPE